MWRSSWVNQKLGKLKPRKSRKLHRKKATKCNKSTYSTSKNSHLCGCITSYSSANQKVIQNGSAFLGVANSGSGGLSSDANELILIWQMSTCTSIPVKWSDYSCIWIKVILQTSWRCFICEVPGVLGDSNRPHRCYKTVFWYAKGQHVAGISGINIH